MKESLRNVLVNLKIVDLGLRDYIIIDKLNKKQLFLNNILKEEKLDDFEVIEVSQNELSMQYEIYVKEIK